MKDSEAKLTPKQEQAIAAMLRCGTQVGAAKTANVGEATLWRWLQEPAFKARYREARQAVLLGTIAALQGATADALAALQRNLACGTASVEVSAARAILEQAFKAAELSDLMERVDEIEARLKGV